MLRGLVKAGPTARGVALAVLVGLASTAAAGDEPAPADAPSDAPATTQPWSTLLRQQLQQDKGCTVVDILSSNEFKVGDETMLEGRVSCIDGRQFDFNRRQPHMKFELRICDPVVC